MLLKGLTILAIAVVILAAVSSYQAVSFALHKDSSGNITQKSYSPRNIPAQETKVDLNENLIKTNSTEFVPGEIIVKFKDEKMKNGQEDSQITELDKKYRVISSEKVLKSEKSWKTPLDNVYKLKIENNADVESTIYNYLASGLVEYAEPNYIYHTMVVPNDTRYSEQWSHQKMQSELGWNIERGNPNITIAIVDTGVDWNHPDIAANIWNNTDEIPDNGIDDDNNGYIDDVRGWDFVDTNYSCYQGEDCRVRDNNPMDFHGHGTHCSGIAAAVSNNSIGIAGVCWYCKIMPARAGYVDGDGYGVLEDADSAAAIVYAADNGANVISMSWGGYEESALIKDALNYAYSKNVVLVAAAGNEANNFVGLYPASYENVISVVASTSTDTKADFSNFGLRSDVSAPGEYILSTLPNNSYAAWSGTSMATPHVAGLAGLILSKYPWLSNNDVRKRIWATTDNIYSPGWDDYSGYGRINVRKAVSDFNFTLARIKKFSPGNYFRDILKINGTAVGNNFLRYEIAVGEGTKPVAWTTNGISLTNGGNTEMLDSELALWNATTFNDGAWTLRLRVYGENSNMSETNATVTLDKTLHEGWPQHTEIAGNGLVAGDINNDGKPEIITVGNYIDFDYLGFYDPSVYAWYHTGTLLENWPRNVLAVSTIPSLGDVNNDGYSEIVSGDDDIARAIYSPGIYVRHHNGSLASGWPVWLPPFDSYIPETVVIDDIDNDGNLEILASDIDGGKIYAFHSNGSLVRGWPVSIPYYESTRGITSPSIADVDNDGKKEIFAGANNYYIYAWRYNGSILDGWPVFISAGGKADEISHAPLIGDVDGDDELEIISGGSYVWVWNRDGSLEDGWPLTHKSYMNNPYNSEFVLGDMDGDGIPEIVGIVSNSSLYNPVTFRTYVFAVRGNGSSLSGWPVMLPNAYGGDFLPVIGDIDGDQDKELVVGFNYGPIYRYPQPYSFNKTDVLYAFHHNGTISWSKEMILGRGSSPAIGDFDGDGLSELAITSNPSTQYYYNEPSEIYVWDMNGSYDINSMSWPMYKHDAKHTGLYKKPNNIPDASNIECRINNMWANCSVVYYGDNITAVRSACTPVANKTISNVYFVLQDPYNITIFEHMGMFSSGWWTYDNDDVFVQKFGKWKLRAVCTDVDEKRDTITAKFDVMKDSPLINQIMCQENNNAWKNCSEINYKNNITKLRVNCTTMHYPIINATFGVTFLSASNFENTTFVDNVTTQKDGEWLVYDNADIMIYRAGVWNITASCSNDGGYQTIKKIGWYLPFGRLEAYINLSSTEIKNNSSFVVTASIRCTAGDCGNVSVFLSSFAQNDSIHQKVNLRLDEELVKDTYLDSWIPNKNYGSDIFLVAHDFDVDQRDRSLVELNLSWLPEVSLVEKATITLMGCSGNNPCGNISLYRVTSPWEEYQATWFNRTLTSKWTAVGGDFRYPEIDRAKCPNYIGGSYTWNITRLIQSWSINEPNYGFLLKSSKEPGATSGGGDWLCSSNHTNLTKRPVINFTFIPALQHVITMRNGMPLYTNDENPVYPGNLSCLQNMKAGDFCNQTWNVTATGDSGKYALVISYLPSEYSFYVVANATIPINVTILPILAGDVNSDCRVDVFDLARVGKCFSQTPAGLCEPADLDRNGAINIFDLVTVGINFGRSC